MPEQSYPPGPNDLGALTIPRQLQRWLDVNPQNGPLRRIQKYFVMPTFEVADRWDGYSDIVCAFNYEAPKNFSLKRNYDVPSSPNYVLCISYRVGNIVTRYLLWDASGSNLNMDIPAYVGQPILKNFRLEIWNTSQGASSSAEQVTFGTSVRGPYDYRYQTDMALVTNDTPVLDFWDDAYGGDNIIPPNSVYGTVGTPAFRLSVTPGLTYTYQSGPANVRVVKTNDDIVFTNVAQAGDPSFVGDTLQPDYYLFLWTPPPPPAVGDPVVAEVIAVDGINPFAMPLTFPDNAVSATN